MHHRFGALVERDYRLLFSATFVTSLGDAVSAVALAFAVLATGSEVDLGLVLASRQAASASVLLLGGVLADRLPRNRVLVGASLVQGAAQAATAAAVLAGHPPLAVFIVLSVLYGLGDGLVAPAEVGLVPDTVSPARLQQANALQGLSRSGVRVLGPAVGGILVVAASPGAALALDSASFFACAVLLARIRIPARLERTPSRFFADLREGWREFTARTWLWSTVLVFGVSNVFFMFWSVLGPVIAKDRLGGAGAWAVILSSWGVGSIVGGLLLLRLRPSRPLVTAILVTLFYPLQMIVLATGAPTALVAGAAFLSGIGISVSLALWFTILQREVPEHARSRVSSYDALGSFVLTPLGAAIAGPLGASLGADRALVLGAGVIVACYIVMLLMPSVWAVRGGATATAARSG